MRGELPAEVPAQPGARKPDPAPGIGLCARLAGMTNSGGGALRP